MLVSVDKDNSHKHAPGPSKTLEKSDREEKDSTRGRSVVGDKLFEYIQTIYM